MNKEIIRYQEMLIQCEADFIMVQKERDAYLKLIAKIKKISINKARKWADWNAAKEGKQP
jgi:hypothetical protein